MRVGCYRNIKIERESKVESKRCIGLFHRCIGSHSKKHCKINFRNIRPIHQRPSNQSLLEKPDQIHEPMHRKASNCGCGSYHQDGTICRYLLTICFSITFASDMCDDVGDQEMCNGTHGRVVSDDFFASDG
ncbi:hypothetical protein CEXT_442391 [Caerostris extrusa]|uniref:Uncharacterized protein n=1 Tax=Caerostris extrusa TaxID=172846 RepID=A0AAV4NNM7_CAEEX|nr:hypothetical protein CEXT_442391 [Caerostris extrusa]